ncbi:hypothetical protein ABXV24_21685 [Vibrio owensii]|uniref:hypothetical protein n=1 Tax=Vibrio owensii TaxID=696485 RepID=UPI00339AF4BD
METKDIFTSYGYAMATCHALEGEVYELCCFLLATEELKGIAPVDDITLEKIDKKARSVCKTLTFHERIEKVGKLAPKVFSKKDVKNLKKAKNLRNNLAHDFLSENSFLMFTNENRTILFEELSDIRNKLQSTFNMFDKKYQKLAVELGINLDECWGNLLMEWHK